MIDIRRVILEDTILGLGSADGHARVIDRLDGVHVAGIIPPLDLAVVDEKKWPGLDCLVNGSPNVDLREPLVRAHQLCGAFMAKGFLNAVDQSLAIPINVGNGQRACCHLG